MLRQTILIVDDASENIVLLSGLLKDHYKTKIANNGEQALQIVARGTPPDLILLDIEMPDKDGYTVCKELKENPVTRSIPVIFLTGKTAVEDEAKGFELGAVDYITKPISPPILLQRIKIHLMLKEAQDSLRNQNELLEQKVGLRTRQISEVQDVVMFALGTLAEFRHAETGEHIRRTQHYVKALAEKLKDNPRFSDFLTAENIEMLYKSAPLHDIGKVAVSDEILLKPGKLTEEEFAVMKEHTTYGRDAIVIAEANLTETNDFLQIGKEIAYSHQEMWDGSGYPEGLSGDDIPISARLMALADVYDALISKRVYKPAIPHEEAVQYIVERSGTHFDPDVVAAFMEISDQFLEIANKYTGENEKLFV